MTTASDAFTALRAWLEASDSGISIPLRWQGEDGGALPDTPAALAFVIFDNNGSGDWPEAFGGGPAENLYLNNGFVEAYVFVPNGQGLLVALDHAETIAARMREFRDDDILCNGADVKPIGDGSRLAPPGLTASLVNNYQCALAEGAFHFYQIG